MNLFYFLAEVNCINRALLLVHLGQWQWRVTVKQVSPASPLTRGYFDLGIILLALLLYTKQSSSFCMRWMVHVSKYFRSR